MAMTKQLLIVDDEDDIRAIVQAALEELGGWQTLGAASGAEGLRLAQQGAIDGILLDISMPDMAIKCKPWQLKPQRHFTGET